MKITDAVHEFILYKQSLGMTYKNRALKLTAFARLAGPVEIDSISPETVRRFLDGDRPVTAEWFNKFSALKMFFRVRVVTRLCNTQYRFRSHSQRIRGSSGPTSTPWKKCRR